MIESNEPSISNPIIDSLSWTIFLSALQRLANYEMSSPRLFDEIVTSLEHANGDIFPFINSDSYSQSVKLIDHLPEELVLCYSPIFLVYQNILRNLFNNLKKDLKTKDSDTRDSDKKDLEIKHYVDIFDRGMDLALKFQSKSFLRNSDEESHDTLWNSSRVRELEDWLCSQTMQDLKDDQCIIYLAFVNYLLILNLPRLTFPIMPTLITCLSEQNCDLAKLTLDNFWSWSKSSLNEINSEASHRFFWVYLQFGCWHKIYTHAYSEYDCVDKDAEIRDAILGLAEKNSEVSCPKSFSYVCKLYQRSKLSRPRLLENLANHVRKTYRSEIKIQEIVKKGACKVFESDVMSIMAAWSFMGENAQREFTSDDERVFKALLSIVLNLKDKLDSEKDFLDESRQNNDIVTQELENWADLLDSIGPISETIKVYRSKSILTSDEYNNLTQEKVMGYLRTLLNEHVLGSEFSNWREKEFRAIDLMKETTYLGYNI